MGIGLSLDTYGWKVVVDTTLLYQCSPQTPSVSLGPEGHLSISFKKGIENGQDMWTYQFDQWSAMGPAQSKDLVILFDKKNLVKAYRYTTSNVKNP